jgi:hypothetical protein
MVPRLLRQRRHKGLAAITDGSGKTLRVLLLIQRRTRDAFGFWGRSKPEGTQVPDGVETGPILRVAVAALGADLRSGD